MANMKNFILVLIVLCIYNFVTTSVCSANDSIDVRIFSSFYEAVTSPTTKNKTILITVPVSCNNLTIPSDRSIRVMPGGSINNTGTLTVFGQFEAGLFQVFNGSKHIYFKPGAVATVPTKWFGAMGDGVSDDTDAIQAAVESFDNITVNGEALVSHQITIDKTKTLSGKFKLSPYFLVKDRRCVFYNIGDNSFLDVEIDFNGNGITGILDDSYGTYAKVLGKNLIGHKIATNGIQSVVNSIGKNSKVIITGYNIVRGTSDNDSVPRLWTTDTGATNCVAESITGNNINDGWVDAGTRNVAKSIVLDGVLDNGIYIVGKNTNSKCEYLEIRNSSNIEGFVIEGNGFTLSKALFINCSGSSGLQNATNVNIGTYELVNCNGYVPLRSRPGNIASFANITNLTGTIGLASKKNGGGIFQFIVGSVSLNVDTINVTVNYSVGSTLALFNWKHADYFNIQKLEIHFNDITGMFSESDIVRLYLPIVVKTSTIVSYYCSANTRMQMRMYFPKTNLILLKGNVVGHPYVDLLN